MRLFSIAPWLGSGLAIVADSGLRCGHGIALVAGNRHKAELRKAAILHSTKNAPVLKNQGMKFRYRDSPLTLLLGFWCSTITLLLFRTFSIAPWLGFELAFVADSGLWNGHCIVPAAGNRYKAESRKRLHSQQHEKSPTAEAVGDSLA